MNVDHFQYNFVDVDNGKEYQDPYANVHKLKSDYSKWLCEGMIADTWLVKYQQIGNKSYIGSKVVSINVQGVSFQ